MNPAAFLDHLPPHLRARTHELVNRGEAAANGDRGDLVMCWIDHANRVDENPLPEVAAEAARGLGCPLVVHAGFGGRHPHANDRHACFVLEGLRKTQAARATRGIRMSITPPPPVGVPSGLRRLAPRARRFVAEGQPVRPYLNGLRRSRV